MMESLCESCILYGFCDGRCGDTDPLFYWEEEQNDSREYLENLRRYPNESLQAKQQENLHELQTL